MAPEKAVKTKKEAYLIEGMSCSGCERAIQRVVSNLEGVAHAKADLASTSLALEYDPGRINIDSIKSAVGKLGYKIVGERPAEGQREGSDEGIT
jgi:P-type Cu+ transporter